MTDPTQRESPDPLLPQVELLVHRWATDAARTRRPCRLRVASAVAGAVTTCLAVTFLLVAPSGNSLASPQHTIAAAIETLDGRGVLHWVRRTDYPRPFSAAGMRWASPLGIEHEWIDLATGDLHRVANRPPNGRAPRHRELWIERGTEWFTLPMPTDGPGPMIRRRPLQQPGRKPRQGNIAAQVRSVLALAAQGRTQVSAERSEDGTPLVVVTDRNKHRETRIWLTREDVPRLVRWTTTIPTRNPGRLVTTRTTTETWEILPRTAAALANVRIPSTAVRRN